MSAYLLWGVLLTGLSGYRLGWLVASDDLTKPLRAWLWRRAYPGTIYDEDDDSPMLYNGNRGWAWLHTGASCGFCTSVWATAGSWWAWASWGVVGQVLVMLAAAMGVAAILTAQS